MGPLTPFPPTAPSPCDQVVRRLSQELIAMAKDGGFAGVEAMEFEKVSSSGVGVGKAICEVRGHGIAGSLTPRLPALGRTTTRTATLTS